MTLDLKWGYRKGLPEDAEATWGCRAIINFDCTVDVVWDRTDAAGPDDKRQELLEHLTNEVGDAWRDKAAQLLTSGEMNTLLAAEHELYDDRIVRIVGNTNASGGYLYVVAYLVPPLKWESAGTDEPGDQNAVSRLANHAHWSIGPDGHGGWSVELIVRDENQEEIPHEGVHLGSFVSEESVKSEAQEFESNAQRCESCRRLVHDVDADFGLCVNCEEYNNSRVVL